MLNYIFHILYSLRSIFSRQGTWIAFCIIILGFIGSYQVIGISSFCRYWQMNESGYLFLLHFFHSYAWNIQVFIYYWNKLVLNQGVEVMEGQRLIMLGDHTYMPKDGRYMPGVVTIHQDSETQSKPSYFRGHFWGLIGLLIGTFEQPFCLPLESRIHQGFIHLNQSDENEKEKETIAMRIVQMAVNFAVRHNKAIIIILDAFFSVRTAFALADSVWSVELKEPLVQIIVKAKKNYVAYLEAFQPKIRKPGRPKEYGDKVRLWDVFEKYKEDFQKVPCTIYGKEEIISCLAMNLLWKPTGCLLRFVFAETSLGTIVLMCCDLNIDPVRAIFLYCCRVRIETCFSMLKNLLGAFCYRFWTKGLPRHSRRPKKNKDLKKPLKKNLYLVKQCWEAYERFVLLGCMALGILQIVSVKFQNQVWTHFQSFLRTKSRSLPSEGVVKEVIAQELKNNFLKVAPVAIIKKIHQLQFIPHFFCKLKIFDPLINDDVA